MCCRFVGQFQVTECGRLPGVPRRSVTSCSLLPVVACSTDSQGTATRRTAPKLLKALLILTLAAVTLIVSKCHTQAVAA
jgi:hypothetical protein